MKLGTAIWPFQWRPPYEDAIRRIAKLGFKSVELIAWTRDTLDEYYTPARIKALREILDAEGLELSEFVSTPRGLSAPDDGEREKAVEHFARMVEVGHALGTGIVNTVSPTPFGLRIMPLLSLPAAQEVACPLDESQRRASAWDDNWKAYVEATRQCCALCDEAGMRYALEAHPYRWVDASAAMLRLIDHVGSPALGMNVDPSHTFPAGDIPHLSIYKLGNRVFHTHISDNDATHNAHWRPGKGKIDWKAFLQALRDIGYEGVLSLELEDVPGVSHGTAVPAATEQFEQECLAAMRYLRELCDDLL